MTFSTDASRSAFDATFVKPMRAMLNPVSADSSKVLSTNIAALWVETRSELEVLEGADRHQPSEGRTLEEDLQDAVVCHLVFQEEAEVLLL